MILSKLLVLHCVKSTTSDNSNESIPSRLNCSAFLLQGFRCEMSLVLFAGYPISICQLAPGMRQFGFVALKAFFNLNYALPAFSFYLFRYFF